MWGHATYRIVDSNGEPWSHQVPVDWNTNFAQFHVSDIGPVQFTVWKLSSEQVETIESLAKEALQETEHYEAMEGDLVIKEALFRSRNRALIEAKKAASDYRCEACGFKYTEIYGSIGSKFIIAHHLSPLSKRTRSTKTTLDDIALLCANCHAMAHRENTPGSIGRLLSILKRHTKPKTGEI